MMKRFRSCFFLILFVVLSVVATGCKSKSEVLGIHLGSLEMDVRALSNGMKVILVEDHLVPYVSYQTWFRVGSVDEQPGITGISHLFEHLMFKGTLKYGPKEFFEQLEAQGAVVNAFTTRDYTVYYENFIPSLINKVIEMESDRMAHLKLTEEIFDNERRVVLEERRLRVENTPAGKVDEALWALAFRDHPYQWPVIGYPQDLLRLKLSEVMAYFKEYYQPANAALVVVGDFNSDQIFEEIRKNYEKIQSRSRRVREVPVERKQNEERRLVLRDFVASEEFAQAYHITSAKDEDSYALDVLANILFAGTSSRANRLLVDEKNKVVGITGMAFTPTYPGLFLVNGTMKNGIAASEAEKLLDEVILEIQKNGVTQDEINAAVRQLTVMMVDGLKTPYGLGILMGTVETVFGDPARYQKDLEKYLRVTQEDVKRVAQKYLIPNNRTVVILEPKEPRYLAIQKEKK